MTNKQITKTILLISLILLFSPLSIAGGKLVNALLLSISIFAFFGFSISLGWLIIIRHWSKQYGYKIVNDRYLYVKRRGLFWFKVWYRINTIYFDQNWGKEFIRVKLMEYIESDKTTTQEFYEKYCVKKLGRKTKTIEYLN